MDDLSVQDGLVIPGGELTMTTSKSGGPGGQHANKTSSRVTLEWDLASTTILNDIERARLLTRLAAHINADGVVKVTSSENRSQHRNRDDARERLAELIRNGLKRRKRRKKTKPSRGAQRRRLEAKKKRSSIKKSRQKPDNE